MADRGVVTTRLGPLPQCPHDGLGCAFGLRCKVGDTRLNTVCVKRQRYDEYEKQAEDTEGKA